MRLLLLLAFAAFSLVVADARADTWVAEDVPASYTPLTAPDGTAAVRYSGDGVPFSVGVHQPGRKARTIDASGDWPTYGEDVAVAPGGWVVAVWSEGGRVRALVVRPDGTVKRRVLARNGWAPVAAIDSKGRATVAWQERGRVRIAVGRSLERGPTLRGATSVDVAANARGRHLLAWTSKAGVRVREGSGRPRVLASVKATRALSVAINDRGAAVVAFANARVSVVDRAAGGAWSKPHGGADTFREDLLSTVAPDGRAAVAWFGDGVRATAGPAGGAWQPAARLSSPIRAGYHPVIGIDRGDPYVVSEMNGAARVGSRFALGAQPDTTPLGATLVLPEQLPPTTDGRFTITATVTCPKRCDVVLRRADIIEFEERVVEAGGTATLELALDDRFLLYPSSDRKLPIELAVAARSNGEVTRRPVTYAVDVIRQPPSAFKVGPDHRFGMATAEGDRAYGDLVNALLDGLERGELTTIEALTRRYQDGTKAIAKRGLREREDPRGPVYAVLRTPFALAGLEASRIFPCRDRNC